MLITKKPEFCFFALFDASKAIDRVRYCKLFDLLMKRNIPAYIIGVLVNFYTSNYVRVSGCGVMSDYFHALNGMKQGGVVSPVLFCNLYLQFINCTVKGWSWMLHQ